MTKEEYENHACYTAIQFYLGHLLRSCSKDIFEEDSKEYPNEALVARKEKEYKELVSILTGLTVDNMWERLKKSRWKYLGAYQSNAK